MSHVLKSALPGVLVALVIIAAALTTGVTSARSQVPTELPGGEATTTRLAGPTRFDTSVEISKFQFPSGSDRVYLARADAFPDALSGGTLTGGPVLLVPQCGDIPEVVTDEITRLSPSEVIALGGEEAVCDAVLTEAGEAANADEASPTPTPTATTNPTASPTPTSTEGFPIPTTLPSPSPTSTATTSP